ncbi:MAG: helix-turn-helix domain-containing protein [Chloroflexota bacterium]|nr:helix-turn-helix domain-containing protein [Chloroflexota bacterium]
MIANSERVEKLTYTVEECAAVLGISRATAYALAKEGRLPVIRISERRLVVPKAALQRMLDSASLPQEPRA